jgi:glycosyltransferase involved in cell wall biosynthesis
MQKIVRTRVLFIIPTLTFGGAERVIITLLKNLDRSRFKLVIAVVNMRNEVYRGEIPSDVDIIELGSTRLRYAVPKIIAIIWKLRPDVVFSTLGHLNLTLAAVRPLLPSNVRYVVRETSIVSCAIQDYRWPAVWAKLYRGLYKRIDLLVCQSRYMQSDLVERFGYPEHRSVVINNPVDVDYVRIRSALPLNHSGRQVGKIWLVAAGRMEHVKGFDLLIEAIALLADPRIHLSILGDGPLLSELKLLAVVSGVADQIDFPGFQSNPYVWFARADAFVLSSHHEGFPNVVLEALACCTPVIATPATGGVREILENIPECRIADAISPKALASELWNWIEGDRMRVPLSVLSHYSINTIVPKYEEILNKNKIISLK